MFKLYKNNKKLKIWHVGADPNLNKIDGVSNTVWIIAKEQALLGHEVILIFNSQLTKEAIDLAKKTGLKLITIPLTKLKIHKSKILNQVLNYNPPDIVHMHNVFFPREAFLAFKLLRKKIPYIVTPHGGIMPQILNKSNKLKKKIYSFLLEKHRFNKASAITTVAPQEEKDILSFVPNYKGIIKHIPNPINSYFLEKGIWKYNSKKKIVYLGRFDVLHKGIDILLEIAHLLLKYKFYLYGNNPGKTKKWFMRLKENIPKNVYFNKPVYGYKKIRTLSDANLYIQTSRWEVFGISIAEAMYLGVPCAISENCYLSEYFKKYNLGLVLSMNPEKAAKQIKEVINNKKQLEIWSKKASDFTEKKFNPKNVVLKYINLYREIQLR